MSFFETFSLKDLLLYSPYDNKTNLGKREEDEELFKQLFVDIEEFKHYQDDLLRAITPDSNEFQSWYILSGYSGNGKTTFLHWFKEQVSEDYYFEIINLVQNAVGYMDGEALFRENIRKQLNPLLRNSKALPLIIEQEDGPVLDFLDIELSNGKNLWEELGVLQTITEDENRGAQDINRQIRQFTKNLPFTQLLILYLLESLIRNYRSGYQSFTFCFDNLDEIEFKYLTKDLWDQFLNIWDMMNAICQENFPDLRIEFSQRVTFMLVFREANLAVSSAQFLDRIQPWYRNRRFILSDSAQEIIHKRMDFAREFLLKQKATNHFEIARIINEEPYTNRVFLPLFNYDYRKLIQALLDIADNRISDGGSNYALIDVKFEDYQQIFDNPVTRNGARGIILHALIKHLIDHNDLEYFALEREYKVSPQESHGYYRPSRMILTVICNLSYPDGFPQSPETIKKYTSKRIRLFELYKYISRFYDNDELFDWLPYFFLLEKASWAHLISIYGKELEKSNGGEPHLSFEKEKNIIHRWKAGEITERQAEEALNHISLHINASGYIYLRYLTIHFEYFSSLSPYNNPYKRYKPLFLATNFIEGAKRYEFEVIINDVLQQARTYKKNMDDFLTHHLDGESRMDLQTFGKSVYTFRRGQEVQKNLYGSRVMTTHIRYLDNFRYFLLHNEAFKAECAANEALGGKNLQQINKYLVGAIRKYAKILQEGIADPTMDKVKFELMKNVEAVAETDYDVKVWKNIGDAAG